MVLDRTKENFRRITEEPAESPFKKFGRLLSKIIIPVLKWGSFIVFLLLIFFIINLFLTGTAQAFAQRGLIAVENTPIGPLLTNLFSRTTTLYLEPEKIGTDPWKSTITKNKDNRNLGLEFGRLNPLKTFYYSGEPIEAFSQVEMDSLSDIDIEFECKASKKLFRGDAVEGESDPQSISKQITPEDLEGGRSIFISKPIKCIYPEFEKEEGEKTEIRLELSALYKFTTKAYYDVYVLSEEEKTKLRGERIEGMDIFRDKKVNDPNLYVVGGKQVDTKPVNTPGPFEIKMKSKYSQPLTETDDYFFAVALKKDLSWSGDIRELTNFFIEIPDSFEINEGGDFEFFGENPVDNYKKYKLKESTIERVNKICEVFKLQLDFFDRECIDKIENSLDTGFSGSFSINQIKEEDIYFESIRLQAEYVFASSKSTIVPLVDKPFT